MTTQKETNTTENQVVVAQENTPAVAGNYITSILEENKRNFLEDNAGLDLDFVRMGDWLKMNKKGNFVEKDNEEVSYGDQIDVVIGYGEKRYTLWGKEGSPEDGEIICLEPTEEEAYAAFNNFIEANPEAAERYTADDIKLRYLAYVVPVETLAEAAKNDDVPPVYIMSFATTDTYLWGRYALNLYNGKYKNVGIPRRTPANRVVTRLISEERKVKGSTDTYLGLKFEAVGVFKEEDYGIKRY